MATNTYSFTAPTDILAAQQALDRQRKMAELLQQQAMEPDNGSQVVSGWVVNDAMGKGLSKLGTALMAKNAMDSADERQKSFFDAKNAYTDRLFSDYQNALKPRTLDDGTMVNPTQADITSATAKMLMGINGDPTATAQFLATNAQKVMDDAKLDAIFKPAKQMPMTQRVDQALQFAANNGQAGPTNAAAGMLDTINANQPVNPLNPKGLPTEQAKFLFSADKGEYLKNNVYGTDKFGKIDPKDYDSASVAKFAKTGNYADLVPVRKMEVGTNGQVYNPFTVKEGTVFGKPEVKYLDVGGKIKRIVDDANLGTSTVTGEFGKSLSPDTLYTGGITMRGQNMTDARAREQIMQPTFENGQWVYKPNQSNPNGVVVKPTGYVPTKLPESEQKVVDAKESLSLLQEAKTLAPKATSSYFGTGVDVLGDVVGLSGVGADNAARLKVIGGYLTSKVPKMSGPQSDKDVAMYKEMAGRVGDSTIPVSQKMAAIDTMIELNKKYADQNQPPAPYRQRGSLVKMPDGSMVYQAGVK